MKLEIPPTNPQDNKRNEVAFEQAYGKSYRKMKKDELAQMIVNQSVNVMKFKDEAYKVSQIALAFRRQRDHYHKLIRQRDGLDKEES
jgi:hypothetical protein